MLPSLLRSWQQRLLRSREDKWVSLGHLQRRQQGCRSQEPTNLLRFWGATPMGPDVGLWSISFSGVECLQLITVGSGLSGCYDHAYFRQGAGLNWGRTAVLLGLDWSGRDVFGQDRHEDMPQGLQRQTCMLFTHVGTSDGSSVLTNHQVGLLWRTKHRTSTLPMTLLPYPVHSGSRDFPCGVNI